jgi:Tol biopolymer transport system component/predicted Ser/Thr protein kinase
MPLAAGTRLGPYEIVAPIGKGGMGEVWKAGDTRLGRDVAIKISDEQFSERFEREARAVAALNHPNICHLYDAGPNYLVMEYIEGTPLKGPLPVEKAVEYSGQILDALDAAHRKSITHRDLKPANILVTKQGIKLLDFGLAKQAVRLGEDEPTKALTDQGQILGTLHYMSPEQLQGKDADPRSDLFSFGCVLYEMLSGKRAFEGQSSASVIAAILERPAPSIANLAPPAMDRLLRRCLAKDPDDRWQTARDLEFELRGIYESGSRPNVLANGITGRKGLLTNVRLAWSVAAFLSVGLIAALALGAFVYLRRAPQDVPAIRFLVSPPGNLAGFGTTTPGTTAPVAVSPDGRRIAFVAANNEGKFVLWVRSLDTLAPLALAATEGASSPFWSPDSRFLGFFAGGKLKKIDISGGPPLTLCDASNSRGATWSRDGVIIFNPANQSALQKVDASGGAPSAVTVLTPGETAHMRPSFLPDGRHFLYRAVKGGGGGPVYVASLDSSERKLLLNADSQNVLYSRGHLLFLRETTLMAQPFAPQRLALTGDAIPVAEQIQTMGTNPPYGVFSVSENGVLAYQSGLAAAGNQLMWFDRTGNRLDVLGDPAQYGNLELSPDGKRASISLPEPGKGRDIWLFDIARGLRTRFTFDPAEASSSIWSPDGSHIVFNSRRKGHLDLYQKASNGSGTEELLLENNFDKYPNSWSPDGRYILYSSNEAGNIAAGYDLFVLPLSGDRKPIPFLNTKFDEAPGRFSPDGRWIAYNSNESGKFEVYVSPFPATGAKWQVSAGGGDWPRWRRDGMEIFYVSHDYKLMSAAVNGKGASFEPGSVKPLFQTRVALVGGYEYDVSADGQRLLINTVPEQTASAPITVVLNWDTGFRIEGMTRARH